MARRPQQRTIETRRRALDAVLELVADGGPRAVTFRAVSTASGVALGALTYHFPSHRDLLSAAYQHHLAQLEAEAVALPIEALMTLDHSARVDAVFAFLETMATSSRRKYIAEFELSLEMARDETLRADAAHSSTALHATAVDLLRQVGATDPETDATIMSAAMEGLLLGWIARPGDRAYEARAHAAIDRLISMFVPVSTS